MSAPRAVKYIANLGASAESLDAKSFAETRGFTWSPETSFSEADEKKLEKYIHQSNIPPHLGFQKYQKTSDHKKVWQKLMGKAGVIQDRIAIYNPESDCGLGVIATDDIPEEEFLPYSGIWEFIDSTNKDTIDLSYSIILKYPNGLPLGRIDAKAHRHYASMIMHAWDKEELDKYEFNSSKTKNRLATANMLYVAVIRPKGEAGPPFMFAMMTTKAIRKGQALLCNYSKDYFLSLQQSFPERFFDFQTGAVLDPKTYCPSKTCVFRIKFPGNSTAEDFEFDRHMLKNDARLDLKCGEKTFSIFTMLLRTIIDKNPLSRFYQFDYEKFLIANASNPLAIFGKESSQPSKRNSIKWYPKLGEAGEEVKLEELSRKLKFTWCNELRISKKDNQAVSDIIYQNNTMPEYFEVFQDPTKALSIWTDLLNHGGQMQQSLALYDTQDSSGIGVITEKDLPKDQYLLYAGEWRFSTDDLLEGSEPYDMSLINPGTSTTIGMVDAKKHRNFAGFIMHAWDTKNVNAYQFKDSNLVNKVAKPNMEIVYLSRPVDCSAGPSFMICLKTLRPIKANEALFYNYGSIYFKTLGTMIDERFFEPNGKVIPPSLYGVKDTYSITVNNYDAHIYTNYEITKSELQSETEAGLSQNLVYNDGKVLIPANYISSLIKRFWNHRFWVINLPAEEKDLGQHERADWMKVDIGLKLRNMAADPKVSENAFRDFIQTIHSKMRQTIIDSAGPSTGKTALHRAVEAKAGSKMKILLTFGADRSLRTKSSNANELGKTAYDLAKANGTDSFTLSLLDPREANLIQNLLFK